MDRPGRSPETMSFLEHLDELRRRLIISLIAVLVAFGLCFTFAQQIFDFLMGPPSVRPPARWRAYRHGGTRNLPPLFEDGVLCWDFPGLSR